ncbi:hypothetical protein V2I01_35135 [Micromonospora sp. BRA006-A]|nr:hypothetical protein [Micromonospora sp. BRA006-A]
MSTKQKVLLVALAVLLVALYVVAVAGRRDDRATRRPGRACWPGWDAGPGRWTRRRWP